MGEGQGRRVREVVRDKYEQGANGVAIVRQKRARSDE